MSTTGASLRTIWIEIRAMNYSVNVLNDVLRQLNALQAGQDITAISCLNMAKAAMSAGILFSILGSQIGGTAGQFLQYASYGMYAVAAIQAIIAVTKVLNTEMLISFNNFVMTYGYIIAPILAAVVVFLALRDVLGTIPAALLAMAAAAAVLSIILWSDAMAFNIMTLGVAAGLGVAGIIAAMAMTPHQMGTRQVAETGPAFLHKGEVVYNPASGRPTQVGNDLAGGGGSTHNDNSMNIGTVNTKMDTEELADLVKKQQRTIAQNNR